MNFRYCPICGDRLTPFQHGDRLRAQCGQCGWIHFRNPIVGVAVIVVEASRILLVRRRDRSWCIPCGYVEWDESIEEAATRELREETGLICDSLSLFSVQSNFHDPSSHTVGVWYLGGKVSGKLFAGDDATAAQYWDLTSLPRLAFPTDVIVINQLRSTRTDLPM